MKKLTRFLGVLVGMVLIFGLLQVQAAAQANQNQLSEKEMIPLNLQNQNTMLLNFSLQLQPEKDATAKLIQKLEKFQTNDAALKEKISKNWLPTCKEYLKAIENVLAAVEKFKERKDIIPLEEIKAELLKQYPRELETRIDQVFKEMDEMGVLQKLFQD